MCAVSRSAPFLSLGPRVLLLFLPLDAHILKDAVLLSLVVVPFLSLGYTLITYIIPLYVKTHYNTNAKVLFVVHLAPLSSTYTRRCQAPRDVGKQGITMITS